MVRAGELANARLTPASTKRRPQQWGASSSWCVSAKAAMRRPSTAHRRSARSGWRTSDRRACDEVAEVEAGELALARSDRDVGRRAHAPCTHMIVGVHRFFERRSPRSATSAAKRIASGALYVPWASTINSTSGPRARRAARTRSTLVSTSPSMTPTRSDSSRSPARRSRGAAADPRSVGHPPIAYAGRVSVRGPPQDPRRASRVVAEQVPQGHVDPRSSRRPRFSPSQHREASSIVDA